MIRALLSVSALFIALSLPQALADDQGDLYDDIQLDELFQQMDLTMRRRNDVMEVMNQFREDREKAEEALEELSETLPPQEEISATTVYSDIVLESRLNRILRSDQVEQIMSYIREQRSQRNESQ
ncbi:hypothetical protein OOT55_03115 [Marinimicrobium sp. C6131]|uniref:hypothetical protein n=1 Tax=Marinimicrobium sp. C6131 TaxID=3022676 RepID=UPI00223CA91C|nr:hypothetical protein [Marinimicrobium sp. C6131]UZJ45062.1 hypothetical protein OOT55_03115 [Marinimicrobium sp. C6131]